MNTPSKTVAPWFRHRWPWFLMIGPAIAIAASIASLVIAVRTDDGLVADDYYKRGLAINQVLERNARAAALGVSASVDVAADGAVAVRLEGGDGSEDARPPAIRLWLAHPTRAGDDRAATLVREGEGRYAGRVTPVGEARWRVIVETDRWRLPAVETTLPAGGVRLAPGLDG